MRRPRQLAVVFCFVLGISAQTPASLSPDSLEMHPKSPSLLSRLLHCSLAEERRKLITKAITQRDYKSAERMLVDEINRNPASPELLSIAAGVFFLDHDFWNSAIALKKADALQPLTPSDRFALCLSFIALKHGDWARPELEQLLRQYPEDLVYLYWLARINYDDRRYSESIILLEKVIRLSPNNAKGYDNLGLALEGSGKVEQALKAYAEAVRLNRLESAPSPWPPLNEGTLLSRISRNAEAEQNLQEALRYAPGLAQTHLRLGVLYEKEGRESEAIAELKQAISLDNRYPDPFYALVRIYHRRGNQQLAEQALSEFKRLHALERAQ